MKILAVDTSSKNCSVAIVEVDKNMKFNVIITENNDNEKTNLTLDDINLLAWCLGPGSFTGIRIGIASVKAFADVKNIPTVGVTSLESLAYNVTENSYVASLLDCKNQNVYGAMFFKLKTNYAQLEDNIADSVEATLDQFIDKFSKVQAQSVTFVGDGSILYKDLIKNKFASNPILANCQLSFSNNNVQSAVSLAKCAYYKLLQGQFGDSNNLSPLYLRKSQAERTNRAIEK